jgi:hypothetical protein
MGFSICYVVQAYQETKRGNLVALPAIEARDADHARRLLEHRLTVAAGAIAFSRRVDPDAGQYENPVILLCRGRVPDEDQLSAFPQS